METEPLLSSIIENCITDVIMRMVLHRMTPVPVTLPSSNPYVPQLGPSLAPVGLRLVIVKQCQHKKPFWKPRAEPIEKNNRISHVFMHLTVTSNKEPVLDLNVTSHNEPVYVFNCHNKQEACFWTKIAHLTRL